MPPTTGPEPQSTALPLQERLYTPTITVIARTLPQVRYPALYPDRGNEVTREWMERFTRGLAHCLLRWSLSVPCRRNTGSLLTGPKRLRPEIQAVGRPRKHVHTISVDMCCVECGFDDVRSIHASLFKAKAKLVILMSAIELMTRVFVSLRWYCHLLSLSGWETCSTWLSGTRCASAAG